MASLSCINIAQFQYVKPVSTKFLSVDLAKMCWGLLFEGDKDERRVKMFIEFLGGKKVRSITKDTWDLFLKFLRSTPNADYEKYDRNAAWPVLIDQFVDGCVEKLG